MDLFFFNENHDRLRVLPTEDLLELAMDAREQFSQLQTLEALEIYNYFADVYNFRRGSYLLKTLRDPNAVPPPEKTHDIFSFTTERRVMGRRPERKERPDPRVISRAVSSIRFESNYGEARLA